ncbi:DUF4340 domain-containing protein [Leptolyngbya sp. AN02str]|uniref:DUF4340 domain-containing protein n=1 Tax=Leptolyngbya sp. AN02str TaxID=3423363 RepID=UPI003D3170CC
MFAGAVAVGWVCHGGGAVVAATVSGLALPPGLSEFYSHGVGAIAMKLKMANVYLLTVVLILGAAVYAVQYQSENPSASQQTSARPLFPQVDEASINSLTLETQTRSLSFERDENGVWRMTEPENAVANQASVAYLANLVATGTSDRTLTINADELDTYGLDQPLATLTFAQTGKEPRTVVMGTYNFNRTALYALIDPPATLEGELSVLLVSPDFETAVTRPTGEWTEPEAATESPTEAPTDATDPTEGSAEEPIEAPAETPSAESPNEESPSSEGDSEPQ